jgi:hypothetical protein
MSPSARRPVRVAGASGGFSDRVRAIASLAKNEEVDVIVGDWLSELTMTIHGTGKIRNMEQMLKARTFEEKLDYAMFAENFLDCFLPAVPDLATKGVKLAVNAGASDTELLAQLVDKKVKDLGYNLKVAWIEGDDVTGAVKGMLNKGEGFRSLMHNKSVEEWGLDPVCAQCYLGGLGIAKAFTEGADVVICGRVSDASPIIGAAAWWHEWTSDQFDELAGSLIIGRSSTTSCSFLHSNSSRSSPRMCRVCFRWLRLRLPPSHGCWQAHQPWFPHLRHRTRWFRYHV